MPGEPGSRGVEMFGDNVNQDTQNQVVQEEPAAPPASVVSPDPTNGSTLGDFTATGSGVTPPVTSAGSSGDVVEPEVDAASATTPAAAATDDELLTIKQQALQQLTPLVGHLDQSPEEKFRTTMMMIQAADDQTLLKSAFEAAKLMTDDKARAQALLDIINEINYFTQQQTGKNAVEETPHVSLS